LDEALCHGIGNGHEHDWNHLRRLPGSDQRRRGISYDEINTQIY